jgi:hypothetical protein
VQSEAYRLGELIGRLLVLAVPVVVGVWLAIRWHRRGNRLGWLWGTLIAVGGMVFVLAATFFALGGRIPAELVSTDILVAPPGVRLRTAPALESQTEDRLRSDPDLGDHLQDVSVREIVRPGVGVVGVVTVAALDPVVAGQPGQEEGFVRGVRGRAGVEPRAVTVEGESVSEFVVPPTATIRRLFIMAWQHENLFVSVSSADEATTRAVAVSVIRRQAVVGG